jgi:site-specific recombinase XerD
VLTVYRRHRAKCVQADDRISKKCRCPLWATGTFEGRPYRKTLKTRSFERAQQLVHEIEKGTVDRKKAELITVPAAIEAFIKDCELRNLSSSTLGKYRRLTCRIGAFATLHRIGGINQMDSVETHRFREEWNLSPRTAGKELERLRGFFRFCQENDWITKNPARAIKAPKVKQLPRLPFTEKEIANIIAQAKDDRELAFILTLRHTGLRIGDASLLKTAHLSENRLYLYTAKSGCPVHIVLPDHLVSSLKSLPAPGGFFFLRGESTVMHTTADLWRRTIKRMCKDAGVFPDHPHRFRHSLAADLLIKGASVEDVAAILGNSPAIVMKHYSQFIKSRQDRLDAIVAQTWETPKLQRVK